MALKRTVTTIAKSFIPQQVMRQRLNSKGRGAVLLTFDDGPHPDVTPRVLDLLDRWNAKAVFFIPGLHVAQAPHLLGEILQRGHRLGNHTFSHLLQGSFRRYANDIERCQQLLYVATGQYPCHFRPPRGLLTMSNFLAAKYCRLKIVRWSCDSGEYSFLRAATPQQLAENLIAQVTDRAIVLSHDNTEKTPAMLEIALPRLVARGFDLAKGVDCLD
jgi:peptidoglycan-N-acetylglucosamine deacetylase